MSYILLYYLFNSKNILYNSSCSIDDEDGSTVYVNMGSDRSNVSNSSNASTESSSSPLGYGMAIV